MARYVLLMAGKKTYHHEDLRTALLTAAVEVLAESGPEELSLRELARRVGVSHTAPYRHFADKEAILAAVAEEGFRALSLAQRSAIARHTHALDQLIESGVGYVNCALERPNHYRLMFGPWVRVGQHRGLGEAAAEAFGLLVGSIELCQRVGVYEKRDLMIAAQAHWAMVHGISIGIIDGIFADFGTTAANASAFTRESLRALAGGYAPGNRLRPGGG